MKHLTLRTSPGRLALILSLGAILLLTASRTGRANDLAQVLSGRTHPLSVQLKDLAGEWRRVTIRGNAGANGNMEINVNGSSQNQTQQNNILGTWEGGRSYLTKGQTVSANGQTYLVGYRLPGTALDLSAVLQAMATKALPSAQVLTPESALRLSLLNVRGIDSIEDVREFDMKSEIAQSQEAAQKLTNLLKATDTPNPGKTPESGKPQKPEKK